MQIRFNVLGLATLLMLGGPGCSSDSDAHSESEGVATDATCPPGSALSYETFGRDFMTSYCTRCHSSSLSGPARNGAPNDHDFDTFEGIMAQAEHIDEYAAAGPSATNTEMPPSGAAPSEDERLKLGEWLACETAEDANDD
jgi:uncharacterized membrane protein